ncbi:uncharacterized protein LOC128627126 [Artibeus jamaicensis]|uniref:uncharacterized protein LOC128627126 n=1 Tax=Artibeus jamaicensis TaxID=9417 RepID=UPI00235AD7FE|nr:uncharacterized protein LOC128627126 [Artibeus jamaicensis]
MGQGGSTPKTALECLLNNFSDFQKRARGYGGPPPDPEVLRTFSELEWPTFNVGWPTEGTFDLPILYAVQRVVYQVPHPDQMVYIDVWVDIATERPGYIRPCQPDWRRMQRSVCVAARGGSQGALVPGSAKEKPRLYPVLSEAPEDPLIEPTAAPPYNPPQPDSTTGGDLRSPPHTRGGTPYGLPQQGGAAILPLREVPPGPDAPAQAPPRLVYVPFSTSDLYNWKLQNPPFYEKPQGLIFLSETIFRTHQPTWDDCQQILQTLFTSEERDRIMREAAKAVAGEERGTAEGRREALQQVRQEIQVLRHQPPAETTRWPAPPEPGQWIWVLNHRRGSLEPRWIGPFQVLLSTLSAVRVAEKPYWIHLSHTKPAQPPEDHQGTWRISKDSEQPLRLKFLKQ